MKFYLPNSVFIVGTIICFLEAFAAPKGSHPGPVLAFGMGVVLLRRAIIATPQPTPVIVSACFLIAIVVLGDHGLLDVDANFYLLSAPTVVAFVCYGFWEKIEKLWKRENLD